MSFLPTSVVSPPSLLVGCCSAEEASGADQHFEEMIWMLNAWDCKMSVLLVGRYVLLVGVRVRVRVRRRR